ncbi:hypothetical protein M409DRAFT_51105 [Zasmidium cellare ATCC 36951]|uniref:NAD-dependent epimerase/dehydratase domain-containing protein n=1 Tax=Zasmidium cellare ATCC 36951 TaxID=1080233 RepID=A0A6A6CZQ4_ZASCE|nr:uncharacterized protein M409DRAFT_51105 [Zasmidium cellare ATCC 36951]KAF2170856.1 hypothetical protein M409DRAFT_51105 [Zasmidium cellare ATCC 36951]
MANSLVLVTGATGHLGFKVLLLALKEGYEVKAAIRKAEQELRITRVKSIQPYLKNLTFVVVPDITAKDAYVNAVKSVDYVIHCASPIASNANNQGETWSHLFYDPAIQGTISMLEAATKSSSVKRVVITSSIFVLEGWNTGKTAGALDIIPAPSKSNADNSVSRVEAYALSKIFAHHAAKEFFEAHRPSFGLIRITSGYVQGANELNESTTDARNGSNNALMHCSWRNGAHVASLSPGVKASGAHTNFIVAGNGGRGIPWDEFGTEIRERFPEDVAYGRLNPVAGQESLLTSFDVRSSEEALGFRFAGKKEMVESLVGQYLKLLDSVQGTRRRQL